MAIETECQTNGAVFHTEISDRSISVKVDFGRTIYLTQEEAELLESNLHNAVELVLAPYYAKPRKFSFKDVRIRG